MNARFFAPALSLSAAASPCFAGEESGRYTLALRQEVDRLTRENQELKDKLAKADANEAESGPSKVPANP